MTLALLSGSDVKWTDMWSPRREDEGERRELIPEGSIRELVSVSYHLRLYSFLARCKDRSTNSTSSQARHPVFDVGSQAETAMPLKSVTDGR